MPRKGNRQVWNLRWLQWAIWCVVSFRRGNQEPENLNYADYLPPPKIKYLGKSPVPIDINDVVVKDDIDVEGLVSPPFSSIVRFYVLCFVLRER